MFGPKWSQHIDKTRMLHDSIFISWISSSVAPTRTAPPEHSLFRFQGVVEGEVRRGADSRAELNARMKQMDAVDQCRL